MDVQKEIYGIIQKNPGITMTELERKVRTNPSSLREHAEQLEWLGLVKIKREENTTKLLPK